MKNDRQPTSLRISLLGPQGSGKGTQADLLSLHLGIPAITASAVLKAEVARGGDDAKLIDTMIKEGRLVPKEIIVRLLRERLNKDDAKNGFILDGFPRVTDQKEEFEKFIALTHVVVLQISDDLGVERMIGRLVSGCGVIYHEKWNPPKLSGICDKCGDTLKHRDDDTPKLMRERLAIYHHDTEPTIKQYEKIGILHRIDASGTIPVVHAAVLEAVGVSEK